MGLRRFDNDYHRDLFYHGLCEIYREKIRFIGSEVDEEIISYYGFATHFTNFMEGYHIKESIRNIFIPE